MINELKVLCRACETDNDPGDEICKRCGMHLDAIERSSPDHQTICPRCHKASRTGSFFCYYCGKYFVDAEEVKSVYKSGRKKTVPVPVQKALIIMPGGFEIVLTGDPVFIERSDFDSRLSPETLMAISRQHLLITCNKDKFYLTDYGSDGKGSTNHTKLNGVDIYHKKRKALKEGDKIELAGQPELTLIFSLLKIQEPKGRLS